MEPKDIIKLAREKKRLTQAQLAENLNISDRMVQRYEEGKFPKFKSENIKKLDDFLETNIYDILYDKNNDSSKSDLDDMYERIIEQIEARRLSAEAMAKKMEQHYEDSKAEKAELFAALKETRQTINELLKPMVASLKEIPPVLDTIVRNSNEHDKEIMKALDHLVGNVPGTLAKESGKRILKGAMEQQKTGKVEVGKSGK
jgi:ribosome-binding protein aMBF1 (putative translation factor)